MESYGKDIEKGKNTQKKSKTEIVINLAVKFVFK
jgi:hypothetical protein